MKILLVSPLPPPAGGIATWTVMYKDYCQKHDIPLHIVNIAVQGARAEKNSTKRQVVSEIKRTVNVLRDLKKQLKAVKPDVVHLNTSCSKFGIFRDMLCVVRAFRKKVPVIVHCRCNIQDQVKSKLGKWAFRRMAKHATKVLTLNQRSYDYASGYAAGKTVTVPNFIEQQSLHLRDKINPTIQNVIFVGHVQKTKGVQEIVRAAGQLPDMNFTMMGAVQIDLSELQVPENVDFRGNQSRQVVLEELRKADVFLFPSYTEGFANAMTEAMASGLPVITTDVGANREMIEDCGGLVVPVGDSDAIVAALKELNENAKQREEMSAWNIRKVENCYLQEPVMQQLFSIYREIA